MMAFYREVKGQRQAITEWQYESFVRLEGYYHVIRDTHITIIGKKGI